ncbi:MAG: peptidylprolyl isomerase [Bdellovibrionota bacterium]
MTSKNYLDEVEKATENLDFENKQYDVEVDTSLGNFTLKLNPKVAPGHCRNMIGLAKSGFYDGLLFHRIIDGFMIQGGCPQGTGTGGPGYQIQQEFNPTPHRAGVLSMARAQNPDSAGSQFFVCVADATFLDNQYTAFGETKDDESLKVVQSIGKVATGANDRPVEDVVMKSVRVVEYD